MISHQNSPKVSAHFEIIVVGGRLSGWISAKILHDSGYKVALIHRDAEPGQEFKLLQTPYGPTGQGLRLLPARADGPEILSKLGDKLSLNIAAEHLALGLQTLESGQSRSFLGFGAEAPESFAILEGYLAPEYQYLSPTAISEILARCAEGLEVFSPAEVTGLKKGESGGWSVEFDNQKALLADKVLYCDSPSQLYNLLKVPGAKPTKDERNLSKWKGWTSLSLTLVHKPLTAAEPLAPWLLTSTKHEPTLGILEPAASDHQISHWLSFLGGELAASEEQCAAAYKEMKRQIKKAYPQLETLWEKISILPLSHGAPALEGTELNLGKDLYLMGPGFSASPHPLWAEFSTPWSVCSELIQGPLKAAEQAEPAAEIHP